MSNINDVAKKAKVSKATVSRYINNKSVSSELSNRIEKAISELNFTPNKIAQGLSTQQSALIGLIVPDLLNPFFNELVNKIEEYAQDCGINCLIFSSKGSIHKEKESLQIASLFKVKGVILITNDNNIDLSNYNIPIVALDRKVESALKNVIIDNEQVGKKVADYLYEQNSTYILYLEGDPSLDTTILRREGFIKRALKYNLKYDIVSTSYDNLKQVDQDVKKIDNKDKYDGIYMGNETIAFSVINSGLKKEIPKITIDKTYLNDYLLDEVYTIVQPINQLAKVSFEKLINWDENKETIILE
ncbi:LacI family DNA-binding transcriptional regulator [Mycoplasma sp. P36-A1]|uniref:LacI family DNA-binding transcriptional regulator n=1 Tax=Mycoplasma sp. P36-A1 TaxID=3252900 RepID=UPI003C2E6441